MAGIARRLDRDPVDLRRQNLLAHGEEFAPGDTPRPSATRRHTVEPLPSSLPGTAYHAARRNVRLERHLADNDHDVEFERLNRSYIRESLRLARIDGVFEPLVGVILVSILNRTGLPLALPRSNSSESFGKRSPSAAC